MNSLVDMYAKAGDLECTGKVFKRIPGQKCDVVDLDAQRMRHCWICMSSGMQCMIGELSYIDLVLWTTMTMGYPRNENPLDGLLDICMSSCAKYI